MAPLPGDSADSARFRVTTRFVRTPCPAVTAPTILSPADLDPRHVFLGPTEVFLRYGWEKSKGYEMLQAPGFPVASVASPGSTPSSPGRSASSSASTPRPLP